jgi:hypothetical protein
MEGCEQRPGLIIQTLQYLFRKKFALKETLSLSFSHMEIYNEKVFDLMATDRTDLPLRQDAHGNIVVANLSEVS